MSLPRCICTCSIEGSIRQSCMLLFRFEKKRFSSPLLDFFYFLSELVKTHYANFFLLAARGQNAQLGVVNVPSDPSGEPREANKSSPLGASGLSNANHPVDVKSRGNLTAISPSPPPSFLPCRRSLTVVHQTFEFESPEFVATSSHYTFLAAVRGKGISPKDTEGKKAGFLRWMFNIPCELLQLPFTLT